MRTNFCTNPSFESIVWDVLTNGQPGSSSSVSATQAKYGTKSAKLVNAGTSADDCYMVKQFTGLTPGTTYTVSGYMWIESNSGNSNNNRGILAFATGVSNVTITTISSYATGAWVRYSVTLSTGAGSTLDVRLYAPPGTVYWDGILIEEAASAGTYFDGDVSDAGYSHAWTGTANASTSTETQFGRSQSLLMLGA